MQNSKEGTFDFETFPEINFCFLMSVKWQIIFSMLGAVLLERALWLIQSSHVLSSGVTHLLHT